MADVLHMDAISDMVLLFSTYSVLSHSGSLYFFSREIGDTWYSNLIERRQDPHVIVFVTDRMISMLNRLSLASASQSS